MPDRWMFNGPFANGTIVCGDCNQRFPAGLSKHKKEQHHRQHARELEQQSERARAAQLREARRLKALAERETRKLEERGLY